MLAEKYIPLILELPPLNQLLHAANVSKMKIAVVQKIDFIRLKFRQDINESQENVRAGMESFEQRGM